MAIPLDRRIETAATPLFAPLGLRLPLRIEQISLAEFTADPALASFTLRSAQSVLEADAIVTAFDPSAEAAAAGVDAPGAVLKAPVDPAAAVRAAPLAATLALTERLAGEFGDGVAVLGTIAAPSTLVERLYGGAPSDAMIDAAAQLAVRCVDAQCGAGVAAIVMLEDVDKPDAALLARFDAAFNLARYYQVPVLYLSRTAMKKALGKAARAAGAAWAVGPGDADGTVAAIPPAAFEDGAAMAADWAKGLPPGVRLFLSSWELPAEISAETVIAVRQAVCG